MLAISVVTGAEAHRANNTTDLHIIYAIPSPSRRIVVALSFPRMSRYRRSGGLIQLAQLLTIASTVSAVSLQNFQTLTIFQVPSLSCLGAYGSKIPGCSRRDFREGVQCSTDCAKGIEQDQANVISACKNIEADARTLLGLAQQGRLLDALCPNFQVPSTTSTETPITTHTFLTPSQTQEISTFTTSTEESSSTTMMTTTTTSDSSQSSTTVQSTPTESDTPTASATPTDAGGMTTIPSTSAATPTPTQEKKPDRGSSGGGSPFDPVFAGGNRISQTSASMLALLTGTLITVFLLG